MYTRLINMDTAARQSMFLWGPRQTGKSTLLKKLWPQAKRYDLLSASEFRRFKSNPEILREESLALPRSLEPIIIDEIQKVPELLDEIHWLMENQKLRFVLSGSSTRKLRLHGHNLLGGRAVRRQLFPLVWKEVTDFKLERALSIGLLPRIYTSEDATELLQAYVADYLKEEVYAEALVRNLPAFSRFLEVCAQTNGEIVVYTNIAQEVGVSAAAVKDYYSILVDTLIGDFVPAFRLRPKRRIILAPKFYLFDVGVCGALTERGPLKPQSELFGRAFEHFIWQELRAHAQYSQSYYDISYWRTSSGFEVDFVLKKGAIAIEVKSTNQLGASHLKGLRAFAEEHPKARQIVVSRSPQKRIVEGSIEVYPWEEFLTELWDGKIL